MIRKSFQQLELQQQAIQIQQNFQSMPQSVQERTSQKHPPLIPTSNEDSSPFTQKAITPNKANQFQASQKPNQEFLLSHSNLVIAQQQQSKLETQMESPNNRNNTFAASSSFMNIQKQAQNKNLQQSSNSLKPTSDLGGVIQFKRNRILVLKDKPSQGIANKNIMNILQRQPEQQTHSYEPPSNRGNFKIQEVTTIEENDGPQELNRRRIHVVGDQQHTTRQQAVGSTNSSGEPRQIKIINKKLITFSNKKNSEFNTTQTSAQTNTQQTQKVRLVAANQRQIANNKTDQQPLSERNVNLQGLYNSAQQSGRNKAPNQLGYRRQQIIQDITEKNSTISDDHLANESFGQKSSRKILNCDKSENSLQGIQDLNKIFYQTKAVPTQVSSLDTRQNFTPAKQVLQIQKKQVLMEQDASLSQERKNQFKIKKVSDSLIQPQKQQSIPKIGQRRPLIIRKNNFIQKELTHSNSPTKQILFISQNSQEKKRDEWTGQKSNAVSSEASGNQKINIISMTQNSLNATLKSIQNQNQDSKLIRLNKTKNKKVDSARRSRIQQINEGPQIQLPLSIDDAIPAIPQTKISNTTTNTTRGNLTFLEKTQEPMFTNSAEALPNFGGNQQSTGQSIVTKNQDIFKISQHKTDKLATTSSNSTKPIRRGQIFRQQKQKINEDSSLKTESNQPSQGNLISQTNLIYDQRSSVTNKQQSLKILLNNSSEQVFVLDVAASKSAQHLLVQEDPIAGRSIKQQSDHNASNQVIKKSLERVEAVNNFGIQPVEEEQKEEQTTTGEVVIKEPKIITEVQPEEMVNSARNAIFRDQTKSNTTHERTFCNSSMINANRAAVGTTFSFKSQTTPEIEIPKFPMSPQDCLKFFSNFLSDYEKKEILDYPQIYFIGAPSAQKHQATQHLDHNLGFDDEKGDYKIVNNDHIGYRYEIKSFLGKGSFGTAIKCLDHKTGMEVALKIVKNKKKYYYQAGVELKILQFLKENDPDDIMNVIHLNDYVIFRKHLCIGFELLSMNMFEFLKINDFNGFDHNLIRRFAIQLLYALKYLRMFQIIHCDLKPENILLKEPNKSGIKIIDFGSSAFQSERVYTYIQSRFYRAPEIMLGIPYDCSIDMWSFGCIMAELYIGYPIFPGDSEHDQMSRIMEMIGQPSLEIMSISERKMRFFKQSESGHQLEPIMLKNSRGKIRKILGKPLTLVIGDEDPDFTDFVVKCLEMDPKKRLTPDDALKHLWVLKGLPPQVLIHHQKMHNIPTPELPAVVLKQRNDFLREQKQLQQNPVTPRLQIKTQDSNTAPPPAQQIYPGSTKSRIPFVPAVIPISKVKQTNFFTEKKPSNAGQKLKQPK